LDIASSYGLAFRISADSDSGRIGSGGIADFAAIALKSPITQSDVVNLRGSGAYQHVQELVELGFVRNAQADCRSSWLHVTDKFHQYFNLEQLPQLEEEGRWGDGEMGEDGIFLSPPPTPYSQSITLSQWFRIRDEIS